MVSEAEEFNFTFYLIVININLNGHVYKAAPYCTGRHCSKLFIGNAHWLCKKGKRKLFFLFFLFVYLFCYLHSSFEISVRGSGHEGFLQTVRCCTQEVLLYVTLLSLIQARLHPSLLGSELELRPEKASLCDLWEWGGCSGVWSP